MLMIDIYGTVGTFAAGKLAPKRSKGVENVPDIPMFRQNTAAFVHENGRRGHRDFDGDGGYVRVQVLTNAGALGREKRSPSCRSSLTSSLRRRTTGPEEADLGAPDGSDAGRLGTLGACPYER